MLFIVSRKRGLFFDDGYAASVRELPGCVTQGDTLDDVHATIEDVVETYLETLWNRSTVRPNTPRRREHHHG
jgi:predicted RNase H-like HicB family nuclease